MIVYNMLSEKYAFSHDTRWTLILFCIIISIITIKQYVHGAFPIRKGPRKNEKSLSKLTVMIHISVTFPLHPSLNGKGGLWWWWHHLHGRGNGESRAPKKFLCWETSLNNGSKLLWKREDVFLVNKSFENLEVPVRYRQDKNCKEVVDGNYWVPGSQELSLEISLYFFPFS